MRLEEIFEENSRSGKKKKKFKKYNIKKEKEEKKHLIFNFTFL